MTSHSVPSVWVIGFALVNGPSTEILTFASCLRRSRFQRLSAGQVGAYSLPARPRQIISIYGESDTLPSERWPMLLPPIDQDERLEKYAKRAYPKTQAGFPSSLPTNCGTSY